MEKASVEDDTARRMAKAPTISSWLRQAQGRKVRDQRSQFDYGGLTFSERQCEMEMYDDGQRENQHNETSKYFIWMTTFTFTLARWTVEQS